MMKLSTKSTYAVRALIHLARYSKDGPENLHHVAEKQNIPLPYLEQIFSKLKKSGVVKAVRGPNGGFLLSKPPHEINLAQIISALEGPFEPILCSFPENRSSNCHEVGNCVSRSVCCDLDGAMMDILTKKTLGKMCDDAEQIHQIH